MAKKWEKVGSRLYISTQTVHVSSGSHDVTFRIDGRNGAYRVDRFGWFGLIAEAIDGGEGFRTLTQAKAYARAWICAVEEQGTLSPNIVT